MINETKYLMQCEMKNELCYSMYIINIHGSLNINEKNDLKKNR
jgi:hypothetical protein